MKTYDQPWQRIALHARCLVHRPGHARFHLSGIAREFSPGDFGMLLFAALTAIVSQILTRFYL